MVIWGHVIISIQGFKYFLTIVDDFSRYIWIILLHTKFEVCNHILKFITYVENQLKTIRTDIDAEFARNYFLSSKDIIHQTTCIEISEQNGIVKRKYQHLFNVTPALLFQANLPPLFLDFAMRHAAFLINCIPTSLFA